jgi:transcriptional regulator with XRE-family HTH domain
MYNAQITKNRIKERCKQQKISMESLLSACGLGINAIRQINDTKGMASFSLAYIADHLDCSVDYLLGRTDIPEINK